MKVSAKIGNKEKRQCRFFLFPLFFVLVFSTVVAQNKIILKDGTTLNITKLYEIKSIIIVYEQQGSLHDLEIEKIKRIETDSGRIITFDEYLKPVYQNKNTERAIVPSKLDSVTEEKRKIVTLTDALNDLFKVNKKQEDEKVVADTIHKKDTVSLFHKQDSITEKKRGNISNETKIKEGNDSSAMYLKGKEDAKKYYRAPLATVGGMVGCAAFGYGILPAMLIAYNVPVDMNRQPVPEKSLLNNSEYIRGYKKGAHNKKMNNMLLGGIAVVALIVGVSVLSTSSIPF